MNRQVLPVFHGVQSLSHRESVSYRACSCNNFRFYTDMSAQTEEEAAKLAKCSLCSLPSANLFVTRRRRRETGPTGVNSGVKKRSRQGRLHRLHFVNVAGSCSDRRFPNE